MHRLELSRRALRSLRRIPRERARSIFAALEELAAPYLLPNPPDQTLSLPVWEPTAPGP